MIFFEIYIYIYKKIRNLSKDDEDSGTRWLLKLLRCGYHFEDIDPSLAS